ncbi:MAG: S8 family serine peptidase [Candidatus Hodarchaeota archaeon]
MHKHKSIQFLIPSLLLTAIAIPILNLALIDKNQVIPKNIPLEQKSDSSSVNLLFRYDSISEKNSIIQKINQYNPSFVHFYQNFPIGFVRFPIVSLDRIILSDPDFLSEFHRSHKIQVLPSIESLKPQALNRIEQSGYIPPASLIGATDLWTMGIDGSGTKIAIIDSGIDSTHDAFGTRVVYEKSFVSETYGYSSYEDIHDLHGHGTHVAGIAAGAGTSFPGVAYNADLYNLKVVDMAGYSTQESLLEAIDEAIDLNVHVISISLGFGNSSPWDSNDILTTAIDHAVDSGIFVVVSAGNEGSEGDYASISSPASAHKAFSVGATNGSSNILSFSSRGPSIDFQIDPDIVAPGYQIIAPLASGSVIKYAYESFVGINLGNYFPLSGTSMAAPVVSGAVALLKQQFPNANPLAIRAALQESAIDINNESIFAQGAGFLNLSNASELLQISEKDGEFEIISSLPRANTDKSIEFVERITFPGDKTQVGISFSVGTGGTIAWNISDSIKKFVEIDLKPSYISNAGYFHRLINISIPVLTPPGEFLGNISYSFNDVTYYLPIKFNIEKPEANIYLFSQSPHQDDSSFYNYRSLSNILATTGFDLNDYSQPITWNNLSNNDILIISDLESPLSNQEINFISEFHNRNGSILIITSAYPYFNPDPYYKLVEKLKIPIDFENRINIIDYSDDGRERIPNPVQGVELSWDQENPLFHDVNQLFFSFGTAFSVNQSNPYIKHLVNVQYNMNNDFFAMAGYEPQNKGKVLVLGNEHWIYSSSLRFEDGENFIKNIFNWLKPTYNLVVNHRINNSHSLELFAYSSSNQLNLYTDIKFGNGSTILDIPIYFDNSTKSYYLNLNLVQEEFQEILVSIRNETLKLKEFLIFDVSFTSFPEVQNIEISFSSSDDVYIPSWIDSSDSTLVIDQGLDFSVIHEFSYNIRTHLLISYNLEETLNVIYPSINTLENFNLEIELPNTSSTEQSLWWPVPSLLQTGIYTYEIQVWFETYQEQNISFLLTIEEGKFFKADPEPTFNEHTTIRGKNLNYYRNIEYEADIPIWTPGEDIELIIIGEDENSDEFVVHVQFLHYFLWFADRVILEAFELPTSISNKSENIGNFNVPDSPIPFPDDDDLSVEIYNHVFVLLVFIRDTQGNNNIEVIFFMINQSFALDPYLVLTITAFCILIIIGMIILIIRSSRQKSSIYALQDYYLKEYDKISTFTETDIPTEKYCIYCGARLYLEAKYCESCGKKLPNEL